MLSIGLILTSTVSPSIYDRLALTDPVERLRQYHDAVSRWRAVRGLDRIVICDNSGHDYNKDLELDVARDARIRPIAFASSGIERTNGKGAGEMEILQRALQDHALRSCTMIIKCTGRLWLRNADGFVARVRREIENSRPACCVDMRLGFSYADSRLIVASLQFYEDYLLPQAEVVDDNSGIYFEHMLARATALAIADGSTWRPLPPAWISGESGSTGSVYGGLRQFAKTALRYRMQARL